VAVTTTILPIATAIKVPITTVPITTATTTAAIAITRSVLTIPQRKIRLIVVLTPLIIPLLLHRVIPT